MVSDAEDFYRDKLGTKGVGEISCEVDYKIRTIGVASTIRAADEIFDNL